MDCGRPARRSAGEWSGLLAQVIVSERLADRSWRAIDEVEATTFWQDAGSAATALGDLTRVLRAAERFFFAGDARLLCIPAAHAAGFEIQLYVSRERVFGWFGGLNQCFATLDGALNWVARAVDCYELEVRSYAGVAKEWTLRPAGGGASETTLASGVMVPFRSFRRSTVEVRRNTYRCSPARSPAAALETVAPS